MRGGKGLGRNLASMTHLAQKDEAARTLGGGEATAVVAKREKKRKGAK